MASRTLIPEIIESGDGSHTLRIAELNENYHSNKGALTESLHVFISNGLKRFDNQPQVHVLEVGFGTGLNALLTAVHVTGTQTNLDYTTLETYPLDNELISKLNFPNLLEHPDACDLYSTLHNVSWGQAHRINDNFLLRKHQIKFESFQSDMFFDLVYYDAFAPHAQPELWVQEIWHKLYQMMNAGGVMVTYCAKGQVRRDLVEAGFKVERLEGPPGKREMLRATR